MKLYKIMLCLIVVFTLTITSCEQTPQKRIRGKWYHDNVEGSYLKITKDQFLWYNGSDGRTVEMTYVIISYTENEVIIETTMTNGIVTRRLLFFIEDVNGRNGLKEYVAQLDVENEWWSL